MKNSHTLSLINEAFEKVQEFNYKVYINELDKLSQNISNKRAAGQKHVINRILEKLGLHLMYKSVLEELQNYFYSKMRKWSSVGTLQLGLKNPEEFDKVYSLLFDEDSKNTFDWFIKYRVAYAFLGELAGKIFPPKISKAQFINAIDDLKINSRNGLIKMQNFIFKSGLLEITQTWVFEQYILEGKC